MSIFLITGASSGIGAELAIIAAQAGHSVAICARRLDKLQAVQQEIISAGGNCLAMQVDVSIPEQAKACVEQTINHFGGIDILINNAGRGNLASVEDTTPEQLQSIFGVNVFSLWYMSAPALKHMKSKGSGHIINVASVAGTMGFPFNSAYVSAKHAVMGFTASLRAELAGSNINATAVCPDGVITEWGAVTEGGPIGNLFMAGIRESRGIAKEHGIGLAPLVPMLSAKDAAQIIYDASINPPTHDVYTHAGTHERAIGFAQNRSEAEKSMLALYMGMQKAYGQK
jgi:NAD(P)-dependent dehydrogenase (short-subunit alcohol dehydrogenase family)